MDRVLKKIKAVVLGHAVGDALGVPVEFCSRGELDRDPVTDMRGFGTYPVPAGAWSDDTSMTLAALDSLCAGHVDWDDVMKKFAKWYRENAYTPTGSLFDIGGASATAISRYITGEQPALACGLDGENANGNGSLMRIHPFVLYAHARRLPIEEWTALIENASRLTHAHGRSRLGCMVYAFVLLHLLVEPSKASVELALCRAGERLKTHPEFAYYRRIFAPDFASTRRESIRSSGYVVDTLEAAIWCLLTTDCFADCVLRAVNLGEDTDTVAAVAGGLAGALYGYDAIPMAWLDTLLRRDYIEELCRRFTEANVPDRY